MIRTLFLAFIQGATEFIPVSSSGHLALAGAFLTREATDFSLMAFLHGGSLLSVIVFFRRDISALARALAGRGGPVPATFAAAGTSPLSYLRLIILATLPVALLALPLRGWAAAAFADTARVSIMLFVTAAWLALTSLFPARARPLGPARALLVGLAQACAVFPGISRSGSTIATGLFCGLSREESFRFSFLLSLPSVSAAFLFETLSMARSGVLPGTAELAAGTAVSFLVGLGALHLLRRAVISGRLVFLSLYLLLVGVSALIFLA